MAAGVSKGPRGKHRPVRQPLPILQSRKEAILAPVKVKLVLVMTSPTLIVQVIPGPKSSKINVAEEDALRRKELSIVREVAYWPSLS